MQNNVHFLFDGFCCYNHDIASLVLAGSLGTGLGASHAGAGLGLGRGFGLSNGLGAALGYPGGRGENTIHSSFSK